MSTSATPTPVKVLASCSFCGKNNTVVKKLIAGPGVYICNECVGLCDEILATPTSEQESAAYRTALENRSTAEMLDALPAMARTAEAVESDLRRLVGRLRASDTTWQTIAQHLDLEPEVVRARFEES